MRKFYSILRITSAVTLFFFCWTYMPIYAVLAYAAQPEMRKADFGMRNKNQTAGDLSRHDSNAERFEKALEEIREKVGKAEEKAGRGDAATQEIEAIRTRKAEIESLDVELRKEFAATEKKLKDANLPKEILNRHYKFVNHYEDNFKELKTNLDGHEKAQKAQDKVKAVDYLIKTKLQLEKTKPPKKHVPLDPNKLPFRSVKAKEGAPRLKKEEFERDFGPQKQKNLATDEHGLTRIQNFAGIYSDLRTLNSKLKSSPILLAYNDIASDVPLQLPPHSVGEGWGEIAFSPNSEFLTPDYQLAQATLDLPTADDVAQTLEVQFTDDIKNLASQLNHSPVKIYEWVRNNIEFVPTYGSIQGADMCLQSRQCNAIDTASLLIALLRTSNLPARYVYGTIEVPIEKVMNWVGGFTDPMAAATLIASGGIRGRLINSGAKAEKIQMEHVWVETYIPYGNYRGAIMDDSIKTWIPMDGSFKQYTYTNGFDITATVPFSQDEYLSQVRSQNAVHYYQSKIQEYLDTNMPDTSIIDVKGYREITQETYHFLPSTLPYVTVAQLAKKSSIPDAMTAKAKFSLTNPVTGTNVSYTVSTSVLAGKRVTVSYLPATSDDEALIASYGGFLYDVPAYMLNLTPVLRVEGVVKLTGESTNLGAEQTFMMQFEQPATWLNEIVSKPIYAGAYYVIGIDLQGINENILGKKNYQVNANIFSESAGTLGNDDLIGEHLHILATTYFLSNDKIYKTGAKLYNTAFTRTISEAITSFTVSVSYLFSIPRRTIPSGINMDVAMDRVIVVAKNGDVTREKKYMEIAGLVSSYHEHDVFEKIDNFASVSAVRALQVASANGIPIQLITERNISQLLPILEVSVEIKQDIQNAINSGKEVTVPQTDVKINDWKGSGYIVKDPRSGSGTYRITGGLFGSDSTKKQDGMQVVEIFKNAGSWIKNAWDLMTRRNIAYAAEISLDELIKGTIVNEALTTEGAAYENIDCSMLVRVAYAAAGICLDSTSALVSNYCNEKNSLQGKYALSQKTGVKIFYAIADKQKILGSVRKDDPTNPQDDPLIGDMIFWDNTFDDDKDCVANNPLTHAGIVQAVNVDGLGTIEFIQSSGRNGVVQRQRMNVMPGFSIDHSELINTAMRNKYAPCKKCGVGEICPGTPIKPDGACKEGYKPACTKTEWDAASPQYSGELFAGYGTVRQDAFSATPTH